MPFSVFYSDLNAVIKSVWYSFIFFDESVIIIDYLKLDMYRIPPYNTK